MPRATPLFPLSVVFCVVTAIPVATHAANPARFNPDIVAATDQLSVGLGVLHQNYREFNDGLNPVLPEVLDAETGNIPALQVGDGAMLPFLYGQVAFTIARGDTTYDGRLQNPPYTPVMDTTANTIVDFLGRVGYPFRAGGRVVLVPYVEFSDHYWQRDVGYVEDYSHLTIGIGGKVLWSPVQRLVLEWGLGSGTTFLGTMSTGGDDYTLGDRPYWSTYLSTDVRLATRWHVRAALDYRRWEYGQSDVVGGYLEPRSLTKQTTFLVSGGYQF